MASKRRTRKKRTKAEAAPLPSEALFARARAALDGGSFRAAITDFKALLKTEARPEWQQGLDAAYRGRIRELMAKGMLKEALVIGENRLQLCPGAPLDPAHLEILLRMGRAADALGLYRRQAQALPADIVDDVRARFAALYLAGVPELDDGLTGDDPVVVHGTAARASLDAYCRGEDAEAARALAAIPFRSPYRDWALILKALVRFPADPAAAQALLGRIAAQSPFAALAQAARLAMLPEAEFTVAQAQAGPVAGRFAAVLRGWSVERLALWRELSKLKGRSAPKALLGLMHRHREALGEAWVRQQGLRLLIERFPESLEWLRQAGGARLSLLESELLAAWAVEEEGDARYTFAAWMDVIKALGGSSAQHPGSDGALRIALVQRRLESRWHLLDREGGATGPGELAYAVLSELEKSLELDPDDRATYVRLIAFYRGETRLKDARRLLDQALQRWPDDAELLGEALDTAIAGGAFKKAAGFAHRVLALDPINRRARDSLLASHLAHARKQLGKGRADLAGKELAAGREWARDEKARARLDLLQGFLTLEQDPNAGAAALRQVVERLGGGLSGQLELTLEIARLGGVLGTQMKRLGIGKIGQPDKQDLLGFVRALREHLDAGDDLPRPVAAWFEPALKRTGALKLSRQESEILCETLRRCGLDAARLTHARAALKRWPGEPVFELHRFEATYKERLWNAPWRDTNRLNEARECARAEGDTRTAYRIETLLKETPYVRQPPFMPPPLEDFDDPDEEIDADDLEDIIENFGPSPADLKELERRLGLDGIRKVIEEIMGGALPEDLDEEIPVESPRRKPRAKRGKQARKKVPARRSGSAAGEGDDAASSDDVPKPQPPDLFE